LSIATIFFLFVDERILTLINSTLIG